MRASRVSPARARNAWPLHHVEEQGGACGSGEVGGQSPCPALALEARGDPRLGHGQPRLKPLARTRQIKRARGPRSIPRGTPAARQARVLVSSDTRRKVRTATRTSGLALEGGERLGAVSNGRRNASTMEVAMTTRGTAF